MTDEQSLYLALLALYLLESAAYVPRGSAAFLSKAAGGASMRFPRRGVSNNRGGLVMGPLLPGAGTVFIVPQWPVSLGKEGVIGWVAESLEREERAHQTGAFVPFDAATKPARADFRDVTMGDTTLASASSATFARRVAEAIERVRALPEDERPGEVDRILEAQMDVATVKRRVEEVYRETAALRWASFALAILIFVGAPAASITLGFARIWLLLLAGVFLATWITGALFFRAHRRLLPEARLERLGQLAMVALLPISPLIAVRAVDAIARSALHGFHPLAVAIALTPPEPQRAFAAHLIRDARWPRRPVCLSDDPGAQRVEAAYREALLRHLEKLAEQASIAAADVTARPALEEGLAARSYCPRCHAQFEHDVDVCADCGGVPVEAFERSA